MHGLSTYFWLLIPFLHYGAHPAKIVRELLAEKRQTSMNGLFFTILVPVIHVPKLIIVLTPLMKKAKKSIERSHRWLQSELNLINLPLAADLSRKPPKFIWWHSVSPNEFLRCTKTTVLSKVGLITLSLGRKQKKDLFLKLSIFSFFSVLILARLILKLHFLPFLPYITGRVSGIDTLDQSGSITKWGTGHIHSKFESVAFRFSENSLNFGQYSTTEKIQWFFWQILWIFTESLRHSQIQTV